MLPKKEIKLKLKGDKATVGIEKQLDNMASEIKTHQRNIENIESIETIQKAKEKLPTIRSRLAEIEIELN